MIRLRTRRATAMLGLVCLCAGLTACGDRMADLKQYVDQVKARKGGHIEPLPQIKPFETYLYADQDKRSPFVPQLQGTFGDLNGTKGGGKSGIQPDRNRNREYLEQFPLDGLKMVGTLTINGALYALVKDSDGVLHRVTVGNYLGQNYGKILSIDDSGIKLREIVPDGQGGWEERFTTLTLSE